MQQHQWKSDGTESGTNLVFDLNAGTPNGNFQNPFVTADKILFVGSNGTTGGELYSLNTSDAVSLVSDIRTGTGSSSPNYFASIGTDVYFLATEAAGPTRRLYKYDGTNAPVIVEPTLYVGRLLLQQFHH